MSIGQCIHAIINVSSNGNVMDYPINAILYIKAIIRTDALEEICSPFIIEVLKCLNVC